MGITWQYLTVEVSNKGRTIHENGILTKSHTKKSNLSKLPQKEWNKKGKIMQEQSKGEILNIYGQDGWELVSVAHDENIEDDREYIFKRTV